MSEAPENPRAVIGDNAPTLRERLAIDAAPILAEIEAQRAKVEALPEIFDEVAQATGGDIVVDMRKVVKKIEAIRVAEKEPHLEAGRTIDRYFGNLSDELAKLSKTIGDKSTAFLQRKREEEKRRRDEEAKAAREAAAEQMRLAQEAEARAAQAMTESGKTGRAAELERLRAAREANQALDGAIVADNSAQKLAADNSRMTGADLARTRGEASVSTLSKRWDFEIVDFAKVDLEKLRPYLGRDDVEKAIRSFIRAKKDAEKLDGVRIFQTEQAAFR